jgi:hypothetical protein
MTRRITFGFSLVLAIAAHGGCYDAESTNGDGADDAGSGGNAAAGAAGGAGAQGGASAGLGGTTSGAAGLAGSAGSSGSSGAAGTASGAGGASGTAGVGGASSGAAGTTADAGFGGAETNGGAPADSGGAGGSVDSGGEGGVSLSGGAAGEAGASTTEGGMGGANDTGGEAGISGNAGSGAVAGVAGAGGSGDVGPSCNGDDVPLVWLLVSTSSGMFGATTIETTPAWDVIRAALVGAGGALRDLEGNASVGLTLFDGVAGTTCPSFTHVEPSTEVSAVEALLSAVATPVVKEESPLPVAYATTLELVRARPESDKTIVIIANSVPDFCSDGATYCPRDSIIGQVQAAFDDGISTKHVGVVHPVDSGEPERTAYFQALANAGSGLVPTIFTTELVLSSVCGEVLGNYGTATTQASYVLGSAATPAASFTSSLQSTLVALGCP